MMTAQLVSHTLNVPGATLAYDVRPNTSTSDPILMLIGSPMGAAGFATLAGHFADRTVVTYDPRGSDRSVKSDPASPTTPEDHADDVYRLIQALDTGPVDLFASSGGAVNALALVARHPEQVATLVAHEPPLLQLLQTAPPRSPPREISRTRTCARGLGPAWRSSSSCCNIAAPFQLTGSINQRRIRRCSVCRHRTTAHGLTHSLDRT